MSSLNDKLTLANNNVPKTYMAGKSGKDMTDWSYYFYNKIRFEMLDYINTSNGINFTYMFYGCNNLTSIPQLNTSKGTNFSYMFRNCITLTSIPQLDTSNGTNFASMFGWCQSISTIPKLNTSKGTNFSNMFQRCSKLTSIPQLNTSNGTNFASMFEESGIVSVPQLNTSNCTDCGSMFWGCNKLESVAQIDISKSKSNNTYMFASCSKLKDITFIGEIPSTIKLSDSPNLTLASLQSIVNALKVYTTASQTLTLNSASWTVLEASTPPEGYETWKEYISNYKHWNYV